MGMSSSLPTLETLLPRLHQSFAATAADLPAFRMELVQAEPLRNPSPLAGGRKGFRLLFRATEGDLPVQRTLRVEAEDGQAWSFFCVPVLHAEPGRHIEAIFN